MIALSDLDMGGYSITNLNMDFVGFTNDVIVSESDPIAYPVATNAQSIAIAAKLIAEAAAAWQGETNIAAVAAAVAHAESAHGLTDNGGFAGGDGATATYGGAVGPLRQRDGWRGRGP